MLHLIVFVVKTILRILWFTIDKRAELDLRSTIVIVIVGSLFGL